jgi:hypothetical protein
MAKKFTAAEIKKLEKNPHTLKVTNSHLSLTKAAKEEVLVLIREGLSVYQIMKRLGYDRRCLENRWALRSHPCVALSSRYSGKATTVYTDSIDWTSAANSFVLDTGSTLLTNILE